MRSCVFLLAVVAAIAPDFLRGQSFEVASVKPSGDGNGPMGVGLFTFPGGRISASMVPLDYLIQEAFDIQGFQVSGGPNWIHEERFDVDAKPPAASASSRSNPRSPKLPPNDEQRKMLQALLAERFRLRFHRETKEGPVYHLIRTNKELKLAPAKDRDAYPWVGSPAGGAISGDGIAGTNATMALLAARLSRQVVRRPVIDQTGLDGVFDFERKYEADGAGVDVLSSVVTSLGALGLKLEAGKGPIETIVIESVERPTGN